MDQDQREGDNEEGPKKWNIQFNQILPFALFKDYQEAEASYSVVSPVNSLSRHSLFFFYPDIDNTMKKKGGIQEILEHFKKHTNTLYFYDGEN